MLVLLSLREALLLRKSLLLTLYFLWWMIWSSESRAGADLVPRNELEGTTKCQFQFISSFLKYKMSSVEIHSHQTIGRSSTYLRRT